MDDQAPSKDITYEDVVLALRKELEEVRFQLTLAQLAIQRQDETISQNPNPPQAAEEPSEQ